MVAVSVVARGEHIEGCLHIVIQARPMRPSDGWFHRLRRQPHIRPRDGQALERGQASVIVSACGGVARVLRTHALGQHRVAAWRHSSPHS